MDDLVSPTLTHLMSYVPLFQNILSIIAFDSDKDVQDAPDVVCYYQPSAFWPFSPDPL